MRKPTTIKARADRLVELDAMVKELQVEQTELKVWFRKHAEEHERTEYRGTHGSVIVGPTTTTEVYPLVLYDALDQDLDILFDCVKVQIGEARKVLTKEGFEEIAEYRSNPYGKVSVERRRA